MPYFKRLHVPKGPQFILHLISYGHSNGPYKKEFTNEVARLTFSVRDVPSPPAQSRKKYTGMSPRLRTEILAGKGAQSRVDQILDAVEEKMIELEEERSREPSPEPEAVLKGPEPPRELVVAIMCEEGRHRSVTFVEEISKDERLERRNWDIKVEHRDLGITSDATDYEDEESDEEAASPTHADPKVRKTIDKRRKQMRSLSMRMEDE